MNCTHTRSDSMKCNCFSLPGRRTAAGRRECEESAGEMLFNFYPHPSPYSLMTLLKVFSYWQMWQCFGNKSWAKAVAPSSADVILNNWIPLAAHMLSWHRHRKTSDSDSAANSSLMLLINISPFFWGHFTAIGSRIGVHCEWFEDEILTMTASYYISLLLMIIIKFVIHSNIFIITVRIYSLSPQANGETLQIKPCNYSRQPIYSRHIFLFK